MISFEGFIKDLEAIIYDVRIEKTWENVEKLIKETKEQIEKQKTEGMNMFAMFFPQRGFSMKPAMEELELEEPIIDSGIRCILTDNYIETKRCERCKNQCVAYKNHVDL